MTSLVADYGTSSGSESDQDARRRSDDHHHRPDNTLKGDNDDDDDDEEEEENDDNDNNDDDNNDDEGDGDDEDEDDDDDDKDGDARDDEWVEEKRVGANGTAMKVTRSNDPKLPLPTPNFAVAPRLKTSVFANPFVEAEKAKSAILEKHVKMTPTLDDTKMINGRKICWNYRKGRCRFGHNCTFAHDSDLHRSAGELEASWAPEETLICQTNSTNPTVMSNDEEQEIDQENNQLQKRKKRPGLTQNLVPGKKVLKLYKAQQAKSVGR